MRSDDIRTVLDWATLSANDPLIGGSIASRVSQTHAHNDNALRSAGTVPTGTGPAAVPARRDMTAPRYNDVLLIRILVVIIGIFEPAALSSTRKSRMRRRVDMAIQSHLHSNDAVRPTEVHAESAGEPLPKQMSVRPGRLEPAKWSGRVNWRWTLSASTLLSATASHDTDD
jgi:hypothetical protein